MICARCLAAKIAPIGPAGIANTMTRTLDDPRRQSLQLNEHQKLAAKISDQLANANLAASMNIAGGDPAFR